MKKTLFILSLLIALPALSQNADNSFLKGKVVDAETGEPVPYANVSHSIGGTTAPDGTYTIYYHPTESDLRVFISHPDYYSDTFSCAPGFVRLLPLPKDSIQRRNDNHFHKSQRERMQEAKAPEDYAKIYYQDFVYFHGGYTDPYFPFPEWDKNTELRTPTFAGSADSALAILYELYWQDGKEHLYYPIVQLENTLGRRHDEAIVPPDTAEFYIPMQSGTNANLGQGWETDYSQHLLLYTEWALRSCKFYTELYRDLGEPDLWHSRDTAVRMRIEHLPSNGSTLIRVSNTKGQPTAIRYYIVGIYNPIKRTWGTKVEERDKIKISPKQWQEVLHLADTINSLPWENLQRTIDGDWYFFEYRHGDSYRSHHTCSDNIRLAEYLWKLFEKPERKRRQ